VKVYGNMSGNNIFARRVENITQQKDCSCGGPPPFSALSVSPIRVESFSVETNKSLSDLDLQLTLSQESFFLNQFLLSAQKGAFSMKVSYVSIGPISLYFEGG